MSKTGPAKILQWNCRSLSTNLDYLVHQLTLDSYHILVLQSLNVKESKLPKLMNYDYPPVHNEVTTETEMIKTAIYVKKGIEYSKCTSPAPTNVSNLYSSAATIKINQTFKINIVSVYLPKGPNNDNTEWIRSLQESNKKWLVAGDFNAHSPFWEKGCITVTSNRFLENIVDSCLFLLNDGSITRIPDVSYHKPGAIDLSLISPVLAPNCIWETLADTLGSSEI